jgi:sialate O-acetylesterase
VNRARHIGLYRALAIAAGALALSTANAATLLHELFQDHVVLQRDKAINIWGQATPGERLAVTFAGVNWQAQAAESGHWRVALPSMKAGGPHRLVVTTSAGATQTVHDVMIGDVWLCSGQSNMVLQVHRALDSRSEIANSTNDSIRLLTVPQASNALPQHRFASSIEWRKASPATVAEFSATCLYFARELQKKDNVPMGLINAAWGGAKIQSWMSEPALRGMGTYDRALDVLALSSKDPATAASQWGAIWEAGWREHTKDRPGTEPWSAQPAGVWKVAPRELGHWEQWGVPELSNYNGSLWYRTTVRLSKQQAAQAAALSIGQVDESDQTWVNGRAAGAPGPGPGPERTYLLPPNTLRAGENSIVVSVLDTYASGGLHGPSQSRQLRLADGTSVPLANEWRYQLPPANAGTPLRPPWEAVAGLGVIYNGMVAPLENFGLRGIAWYQGESNTDNESDQYQALLTHFMADWRRQFGADLPFFVVQLANYGPPPTQPAESNWAELREAQRLAVKEDPRAGLAVAIDIGDRYDLHPANKQEVGRRLARAARRMLYGDPVSPSGPIALSARREGASVAVAFGDITGRLIAYSAKQPIGFELCGSAPNTCEYADAEIRDDRVILTGADAATATRVRYCWADSPVCTLFDAVPLPAGPFQIEVQ